MNLHEYQAKALLSQAGITVPQGYFCQTSAEIATAIGQIDHQAWVVKAQVHSGARGKSGGVKLLNSAAEAQNFAESLLGGRLVTHQTGAEGLPIAGVYIEAPSAIAHEYYVSMTLNRAKRRIALVISSQGGMDIEEVAANYPDKILNYTLTPAVGVGAYLQRQMAFDLGLTGATFKAFGQLIAKIYDLYFLLDASMIEINPLVLTHEQNWIALDAKIALDDNALYRHPELQQLRDFSQEKAAEVAAANHQLNYIALDGNIGCMVNGAGLAMATMDLIQSYGGTPANFLDVGGGTTASRVAEAFKLITANAQVKAILVNIFGGIVRCDLIAEGIIQAVKEVGLSLPVVVRLEGTNAIQGRELLAASGLNIQAAEDLNLAAKLAVEAAL